MNEAYQRFLESKAFRAGATGKEIDPSSIHPALFPFQKAITLWAIQKGRCAAFADTGLGKTFIAAEWARLIGGRVLIVAPLSVARQTVGLCAKELGQEIRYVRQAFDVGESGVYITNYEMVEHLNPDHFQGVVLDESSILKALDGKTRKRLTAMFANTPYRLCCTATPAPNDITEIANHAEFLGISTRNDMLSAFFLHESNKKNADGWRLKKHAVVPFFRWLASWSMSLHLPSDLGFSDDGYVLPPLSIEPIWVESDYCPDGMLFPTDLQGITERTAARRASLENRVAAVARIVAESDEQWILWCGLNEESSALAEAIPTAVEVRGDDSPEKKVAALEAFQNGVKKDLVTKARIAGFGMNFQNATRMAFVGLNDSWEMYYQAIRRCWRFGQTKPVKAYVVLSRAEEPIYQNIMRKERQAQTLRKNLLEHVRMFEREELKGCRTVMDYEQKEWSQGLARMLQGDCVERLNELPDASVDLSIFSPPFLSLYAYTPTERDMGNSSSHPQFFEHFRFLIDGLLRVTKPGRNVCVHCAQVPATITHDGYIGLIDFRADLVHAFIERGFVYHGEVVIDKDPQAQAIRTHSKGLLFVQLRRDASWLRPALADYILVFRKPGENLEPIQPDITNEEWIEWARPIWYGIKETETLNTSEAKDNQDERHICPLQLGTIARCVRLWSNEDDLVLSPFAGIGSEGYVSVRNRRRFVGIELKPSYWKTACKNLERAMAEQGTLLSVPMVDVR